MPMFYTKHVVEARQWFDTDEKREEFAAWFEEHDCEFSTLGPQVVLGCYQNVYADEGDWVVLTSDDVEEYFFCVKTHIFAEQYTAVEP